MSDSIIFNDLIDNSFQSNNLEDKINQTNKKTNYLDNNENFTNSNSDNFKVFLFLLLL